MVLITGGAGYVGSHVNKLLSEQDFKTLVIDNLIYGHKEAVKWGVFWQGDLSDAKLLDSIFTEYKIDVVLHFAAYAYVGESVIHPAKYYRNNVSCTINLLDCMVKHGVKNIVFSSTCATYGIPREIPIEESATQNPINPYGQSKLMVERILSDYSAAYGIRYAALRYFNAAGADPDGEIGESHTPETHLIPLVLSVAAGERTCIEIYGTDYETADGSCIRDYIHVTDLAHAHLLSLQYLKSKNENLHVNLGNGQGHSVLEVIETARVVTNRNIKVKARPRRKGDPAVLVGSAEKAKKLLGWSPQYSNIHDIIEHAWKWQCNPGKY